MKTNKNHFRASDWSLPDRSAAEEKAAPPDQVRDVERVLEALEAQQLDITAEYHVWLQLGFALGDSFGEAGREYFHRMSRFYPDYNYKECDKQYTHCLRSRGSGIHLATFFYYAKEAGINISRWEPEYDPSLEDHDPWAHFKNDPPVEEGPELECMPAKLYADDFIQGSRVGAAPVVSPAPASSSEKEVDPLEQAWDHWCEARGMSRDRIRLWADKWLRDPGKRKHAEEVLRRLGALKEERDDSESLPEVSETAATASLPEANSNSNEAEERLQEMRRMEMEKWYGQQEPSAAASEAASCASSLQEPETYVEVFRRETETSAENSLPDSGNSGETCSPGSGASAASFLQESETPAEASQEGSQASAEIVQEDPKASPASLLQESQASGAVSQQGAQEGETSFSGSLSKEEVAEAPMPTFPEKLYSNLPEFLQRVAAPGDTPQEKDLLLLGCMVAASACFPTVQGFYDGKDVGANLYLFVAAAASSGKGKLVHCKQLVAPLHWKLREQAEQLKQEYEQELAAYNVSGGEKEGRRKPAKPAERMLFLPANNSTTGLFQLLHENDGRGLIFETEGDTLAQNLKTDFGNYSDGFRKAFHHETISYYRRTDREYIHIETPCLSTVLSGTPKQVITLIPHAEDGLFSRFLFYFISGQADFREVFAKKERGSLDTYYKTLGQELLSLHLHLNEQPPIQVELNEEQQQQFYVFFRRVLKKYRELQPKEYDATVMRLGLMSFRLCMLLTIFRILEEGEVGNKLQCSDRDFENALSMISVLIRHSSKVFNLLPEEKRLNTRPNLKELFLEKLPAEFTTAEYMKLAAALKIKEKSAEAYVTNFVKKGMLTRTGYGQYVNSWANESSGSESLERVPEIP